MIRMLRSALRTMRREPVFVVSTVTTLALGIAATTAVFSLANAILWRSLPVREPSRLVAIGALDPQGRVVGLPLPLVDRIRDERLMSGPCAFLNASVITEVQQRVAPTLTQFYTGECFQTLGVSPAIGRVLSPGDERAGAEHVAVLSYEAWIRLYDRRADIVGTALNVDGTAYTIVGVAERGFTGLVPGYPATVFAPLGNFGGSLANYFPPRENLSASVVGRLLPDGTMSQTEAKIGVRWADWLGATVPARLTGVQRERFLSRRPTVFSASMGVDPSLRARLEKPLFTLMGMAFFVLISSSVSAGNLLLARAANRRHNAAIRTALGASRSQLVTEAAIECLFVLALSLLVASAIGYGAATVLVDVFQSSSPQFDLDVRPDWRVVGASLAATILAFWVGGLAPVLRAAKPDVTGLRGDGNRVVPRAAMTSRIAVAVQVAVALLLVSVGVLLWQTLTALRNAPLGIAPDGVWAAQLSARPGGYGTAFNADGYYRALIERLAGEFGTNDIALSYNPPINATTGTTRCGRPGEEGDVEAERQYVTPEFFQALRIPLVSGRTFEARADGPRTAVLSESLADAIFGAAHLAVGRDVEMRSGQGTQPLRVVGVARDAILSSPQIRNTKAIFLSFWEAPVSIRAYPTLVVRSTQAAAMNIERLNTSVTAGGREYVSVLQTLGDRTEAALVQERLVATVAETFAVFGLFLGAVGLYGLLTLFVVPRRREIGVRLALGASRKDVIWLVGREAVSVFVGGCIVGVGLSVVAAQALTRVFPSATEHVASAVGLGVLLTSAIVACAAIRPLNTATGVQPSETLRGTP